MGCGRQRPDQIYRDLWRTGDLGSSHPVSAISEHANIPIFPHGPEKNTRILTTLHFSPDSVDDPRRALTLFEQPQFYSMSPGDPDLGQTWSPLFACPSSFPPERFAMTG